MRKLSKKQGFTLIELLVVIALTSILLTVVFKPLIASLDLTHRAATQTESQAAARNAVEQVNHVLSNADYVLDPAAAQLNLWLIDGLGNKFAQSSLYTMMEYIPSAHQLDQFPAISQNQGLPIDPTTGLPSYEFPGVTDAQKGLAFPLANGIVIGRIFLGLANNSSGSFGGYNGAPLKPYFNFYEWTNTSNRPVGKSLSDNNPFTLYNAVVPTYIPDPTVPPGLPPYTYIPNLRLFHTGPSLAAATDKKTDALIIHDPNFFYDNSLAGGAEPTAGDPNIWAVPGWKDLNNDNKVEIWENWRAVSATLVRTDKVDLLAYQRDPLTNGIVYDALNHPIVSPLATFKPAFVQNDPAVATNLSQSGNEVPNPISPNFTSQYDHWAYNYRAFVYRDDGTGTDPTQRNPLDLYVALSDISGNFKIVHIDPSMNVKPGDPLPPNLAALQDVSPRVVNGVFTNPATFPANPNSVFGFVVNTNKGMLSFGYPSTAVIHDLANAPLAQRYSPDDANNAYPPPLGAGARRFLSLTALPTTVWGGNQLNPNGIASPISPISGLTTTSMVPGTELVYGPDQRPGVHYGSRIQYTRVSAASGVAGPNQYKINYTNNSNIPGGVGGGTPPSLLAGYIEFDSTPDGTQYNAGTLTGGGNGKDFNGQPAAGSHMLPLYKFNPATMYVDGTLAADPIEVYYNFQMNQGGDVIKIDYMTRSLMIFALEMRLYDLASGKPQVTRLTDKIKVRNLQH